ncbi:hypothetical protein PV05_09395 [Exophiala xenobiotica]|uniref:Uncharacterized protein n=1 Tax=Exophiala xenobiotica TaxID=348802 RepID=A0A0D2BEI2_9EURO|nr:uncharacterized protein PV05_09395 [Exophiala xenobiotica]KIW50601.1 hypothetical protein PV05_09395 [Exophiala xenobiotica]
MVNVQCVFSTAARAFQRRARLRHVAGPSPSRLSTQYPLKDGVTVRFTVGIVVRQYGVRLSSSSTRRSTSFASFAPSESKSPSAAPRISADELSIPTSSISLPAQSFAGWPGVKEPGTEGDFTIEEKEAYAATEVDLEAGDNAKNQQSVLRKQLDNLVSVFLPSRARPKKTDLSYVKPDDWEQNLRKLETPATLQFRSSTPLRKILLDYLFQIEPLLRGGKFPSGSYGVDSEPDIVLQAVFKEENLNTLSESGHDVTDVVSWAWIFSAQSVDLAVQRYIALAANYRDSGNGRLPKFILLQILRASRISAFALKGLIRSILTELDSCKEAQQYSGWGWTSRVCLVVRLLRHARQVAPSCFKDISLIIEHLFSDLYMFQEDSLGPSELKRLSHIFNRFLSLIALPTIKTFDTYLLQQNAQLALIRLMVGFKPQLPLTREGYRALISVQLMHPKTGEERAWAEAKSLAWPPWRRIKSGIEQDLEYPGRQSRAMKLLGRMNQAGYTHGAWEKSAAVLAGWDTDKSPTIQTRAILKLPRQPWKMPKQAVDYLDSSSHDAAEVWAARIQATRTQREAWASFCAYEKATELSRRRHQPYFAMCEKLLAQVATADSALGSRYLAGDVKEVFEDPVSPRDIVYVDREVPSLDDFYNEMFRAGIVPGGRLLSDLLDHAPNIEAGFSYIQDSRWDEVTKDVLRHVENYPSTIIHDAVDRIPSLCLAAFIYLLCRYGYDNHPDFSIATETYDVEAAQWTITKQPVTPLTYAWNLLRVGECTDTRAWNAFLKGAWACIRDANAKSRSGTMSHSDERTIKHEVWRCLWEQFNPKTELKMQPDLDSFRHLAGIITSVVRDANHRRLHIASRRLGSLAKSIFLRAIYGHSVADFLPRHTLPILLLPEPGDLRLMTRILVSVGDIEGTVALVKWMNEHAEAYMSKGKRSLSVTGDAPEDQELTQIRSVLCIIRLFFEGRPKYLGDKETFSFETPLIVRPELIEKARGLCGSLHWPSDEEVGMFLLREWDWLQRVARAVKRASLRQAPENVAHDTGEKVENHKEDVGGLESANMVRIRRHVT